MDFLLNFIAETFGDTTHAFIVGFVGGFSLGSYSAWRIFKANTPDHL
ncbi:hypothetical protein [Campylobacter sp. RM16187]|nr:hypothetical protein [Campylobacter sp. RM16187]